MFNSIVKLTRKEFKIQFAGRNAVNSILFFPAGVIIAVSFITRDGSGSSIIDSLLIWLIIFFSSLNITLPVYLSEYEGGHYYYLKKFFLPESIYLSKYIFTFISILITSITVPLLFIFFNGLDIMVFFNLLPFLILLSFAHTSLLSALGIITAVSGGKNALFGILSVPLVLPLCAVCVNTLADLLSGRATELNSYFFLLSFSLFTAVVSYLVFEKIWEHIG
jgi:heme exporter protein B